MSTPCPARDGSSPRRTSFAEPFDTCLEDGVSYQASIHTSAGELVAFLHPGRAPLTVNNFVCLARSHFYDGLMFHRVIRDFMIQTGCPEGSGRAGPGYTFADELPRAGRYELGSLAMANSGPDTNGSQFFVVSGPKGIALPPRYSGFGKLIAGFEVLETINRVATGPDDRPLEDVTIESIVISEG